MDKTMVRDIALGLETIDKGLGFTSDSDSPLNATATGWNLLRGDLSLPSAVLYKDRLLHNLEWMRQFIREYGVLLAPHGKTTMAPRLFQMQLESGAWGITLATAHQTRVSHVHGIRRVLMANQLVGKENMAIIARLLEDPSFTFYCLVDSADLVDQLSAFFSAAGRTLNVLLELGVPGGRSGVRDQEQIDGVVAAIDRSKGAIRLTGVEVYEGVLDSEGEIRRFLQRACEVTRDLMAQGRFHGKPILTGAGSAWFDVVAEVFTSADFQGAVDLVLRPGCYLTHDVGSYRRAQERMTQSNSVIQGMHSALLPALHIWAYVQSVPEPTRAILTMGKRDAAFDSGLPVPALHYRPGMSAPRSADPHWEVTKMMDQHAYLRMEPGDDVRVGDMLAFDICHPCLTFDKWRSLVIVDSNYDVVDVVQTYF